MPVLARTHTNSRATFHIRERIAADAAKVFLLVSFGGTAARFGGSGASIAWIGQQE